MNYEIFNDTAAHYKFTNGTGELVDAIAKYCGFDVEQNTSVASVQQSEAGVVVTTTNGYVVTAKRAVVTLPLNLLNNVSFDPPLSAAKQEASTLKHVGGGYKVFFEVEGDPGALTARLGDGQSLDCGGVLMATGRRPWLAGLGLEAAGVAVDNGRIRVDAHSCTSVPHIHAVGDVTDRINLTPVAIDEGRAVADALFAACTRTVNHDLVATAVFTQPELASVGLSEEDAKERYGADAITIHKARFRDMHQALPKRGPRCLLKLVVETSSDRVLGCHMVVSHAAEIIQMGAIALGMGATKADFDRTMALHPSISEEFVTMG